MLRFALSLRFMMLAASLGAALGAVLMFAQGGAKLVGSLGHAFRPEEVGPHSVTAAVMQATDAFLFGLVLIIFAYAILFGFALDLPKTARAKLPAWMRIDGIGELKHILIEVILVYLVVDFATDMGEVETHVSWDMLVKPLAIVLVAGALRLMGNGRVERDADQPNGPAERSNISRA